MNSQDSSSRFNFELPFESLAALSFGEKLAIFFAFVGLIVLGFGIWQTGFGSANKEEEGIKIVEEEEESGTIIVDVSGAVQNPGVYELKIGARVGEVIDEAGGFTEEADEKYISKGINLAAKLSDGTKIYIPQKGENVNSSSTGLSSQMQAKININSASQASLETLPGVGPVTAQKIISARPFSSIDDLLSKKVVGNSTFGKIKDLVSVF